MDFISPKTWLLIALLSVLAVIGAVVSLLQLWGLAAGVAFAMLLITGILVLVQVPRLIKINRTVISRIDQLQESQRRTIKTGPSETREPRSATSDRQEKAALKQQLKDMERRLLSVEENAAHASEKSAHEISLSLRRLEDQLDRINPTISD